MRIGMHVRAFSSGKAVAVQKALERGAETIQIFASSPRMWRFSAVRPEADRELLRQMRQHNVRPLFIHAPYLVNLASPSLEIRRMSFEAVDWALERAEALRSVGVVTHAGMAVGQRRLAALRYQARAIARLLGEATSGPKYIFELTAGAAGAIASRFDDAAELLDACHGHSRIRICIDTCHLHAAGYDVSDEAGVDATIDEMRFAVGLGRLALIHANDSRDPRGSGRDRHWHCGKGEIGWEGFKALIRHPRLQRIPVICETPGEVEEDRQNLGFLKALRDPNFKGSWTE
jgi:deoxyribonuclease-4